MGLQVATAQLALAERTATAVVAVGRPVAYHLPGAAPAQPVLRLHPTLGVF